MTLNRKTLAVLLAVLMLFGAMLTACTPKEGGENTTDTAEQTTAPETEAPAVTELALVVDGVSKVRVVRHQDLDSSDTSVQAAMSIRTQLASMTGADISISDDWMKPGDPVNDNLEILVCATNYPQTKEVMGSLNYGDYEIRVVGNKIVVCGYTDKAIEDAAARLVSTLKKYVTTDEATGTKSLTIAPEDVAYTKSVNTVISSMPAMEGANFFSYYDPGDACHELIFTDASAEAYNAYLAKLEEQGYKKHTTNQVTDNLFATYYNDKYTLNVGYYNYNKQVRLVIEPFSDTTLIGLEADNKYDVVTTSQITMVGLGYQSSDGSKVNNGLSVLIRLSDGRFMVVDGGFNRANDATMLINLMKEQSKDYAAKTGGIKVAAWMITHAHGDHSGMIGKQFNAFITAGIKIERFIINFMSDTERNKAINSKTYGGNWSSTEGSGYVNVLSAATSLGSEVCVAHVGQIFWFADVKMEILYTIESYGPYVTNAFNTTSVIIKMTFKDPQTGKETVYMSTGDATGPAFKICSLMYGDYLKSDIVQVAHHGATTWGTSEGTIAAYKLMAPETLLWPIGQSGYPAYLEKDYNRALYGTSNPNWKETYAAGDEGKVVIVPLPYSVGSANIAPDSVKE